MRGMLLKCIKSYKIGERAIKDTSFDSNTESLQQDYLDIFEGAKSDVMYTAQYHENSDIGTTYLGCLRQHELQTVHKTPITKTVICPVSC